MENSPDVSHPHPQLAVGKLDEWCRLFVDSLQYRRAMQDARHTRQEAATDFLRSLLPGYGSGTAHPGAASGLDRLDCKELLPLFLNT